MSTLAPLKHTRRNRSLALLALCVLAFGGYFAYEGIRLWATRPQLSGRVTVRGASEQIELLRDAYGIPHVYAKNDRDAYFGLGYVHAQDRLFQVELQQRMAKGELAALLGADALTSDRLFRTLGLRELAHASWAKLDAQTRAAIDAYVAGYNAAIDGGANAPELIALGSAPTRLDSVACLLSFKLIGWHLSGNMLRELENHLLSRKFSFEELARLSPAAPGDIERGWPQPDYAGDSAWLDAVARQMLRTTPSSTSNATGSNAWVVTGEHSQTGKPLLANDPHLGLTAPAVWYLAHLHAPELNVIGATLPGTAGVWLGRNDHVAWGITNTGSDTQDLYLERLDATDAHRVLAPGGSQAMRERREQIHVRGGETQSFVARATRHGPVVSDADPEVQRRLRDSQAGYVLSLAWTGLSDDDRSTDFPILAAKARVASQLLAAAEHVRSPQQNLLYADDAGAVGLKAIGRLPLRAAEAVALGRLPVPGWQARYDWQGEVPFEELPAHGPEQGRVINANDRITTPEYPHWITSEWELPFRADRIAALLDSAPQHSLSDFARMQLDVHNPLARELLPELLERLGDVPAQLRGVVEKLRAWSHEMRRDSPEALIFEGWNAALGARMYPKAFFEVRPVADPRVLVAMLRDDNGMARYCGTQQPDACLHHVRESFAETVASLRARYGENVDDWRWGEHNTAWFGHAIFSGVPGLRALVDVKLAREGSAETINLSGAWPDADSGELVTGVGPSLRALYDLAAPERSVFIVSPGQSGNPLTSRYRDLAALWERGEYAPMITERAVLEHKPHQTLILSPEGRGRGGNES